MTTAQRQKRDRLLAAIAKQGGEISTKAAALIVGGNFDEWHKVNRDLPIVRAENRIAFRQSASRLMTTADTNGIGGRETARV